MASYIQVPLRLPITQLAWLEATSSRHKLSNSSKAFRCCVNCVAVGDVSLLKNNDDADGRMEEQGDFVAYLSREQLDWLRDRTEIGGEDNHDQSAFARRIVRSCMAMDEFTVFGIVRCKSSIAACEGAGRRAIISEMEKHSA
jgi:hypothetical protein